MNNLNIEKYISSIYNETTIKIHNRKINNFLILKNDNRYLSSSEDSKINIYNKDTYKIRNFNK